MHHLFPQELSEGLCSCHRVTLPLPVFFCFNAGISHIPSKQLLLHVGFA